MLEKPSERIRILKIGMAPSQIEKLYNHEQGNTVLMGYHGEIEGFK